MPADLPPESRPVERARAVAGVAIGYAARLEAFADNLSAVVNRCAGETQRNADALSAWATERERILANQDD